MTRCHICNKHVNKKRHHSTFDYYNGERYRIRICFCGDCIDNVGNNKIDKICDDLYDNQTANEQLFL